MTSPQNDRPHQGPSAAADIAHRGAHALVFVAPTREQYREALLSLSDLAHARGAPPPTVLSAWEAAAWTFPNIDADLAPLAMAIGETFKVDVALLPTAAQRKRILVADMDSTIISSECIDELADFAGVKAEISAITERAMRGDLDFETALTERVSMLRGLPLRALQRCYEDRVRLNPGARTLVRTMADHGARCVLVSGGFTFFTGRVAAVAGFHDHAANTLLDDGAALTGTVASPILGRAAKRARLEQELSALSLDPSDALAIGDGANDLDMITLAGLGVAYRAKPIVASQADAAIRFTSLETALFYQGYRRAAFVVDE
jgi:phosphoserine phosphatase